MSKIDNFKKAADKIKNSKTLKILILSSLLLTNKTLETDLVAQKALQPTDFNTLIRNDGIKITSENNNIEDKNKLENIIIDLKDDNKLTEFIVSSLENNGTVFTIEKNDYFYGRYLMGENEIKIDSQSLDLIDLMKNTIVHETIHMLQDKTGIMNDIYNLKPIDSLTLLMAIEVDAILKAVQAEAPHTSLNENFSQIRIPVEYLEGYMQLAININNEKIQKGYVTNPTTTLEQAIKKLNNQNWNEDYNNTKELIEKIRKSIPENYLEEISKVENNYNAVLANLNQNAMTRK